MASCANRDVRCLLLGRGRNTRGCTQRLPAPVLYLLLT